MLEWPEELVEKAAQAINDRWARGSQGALWQDLESQERAYWRVAALQVLDAIREDVVLKSELREERLPAGETHTESQGTSKGVMIAEENMHRFITSWVPDA